MSLHTFCKTCRDFILVEIEAGYDFSTPNYCEKCTPKVEPASEEKPVEKDLQPADDLS